MQTFFFALKRAHHSVARFGRSLLHRFGITPARFDLMLELYRNWALYACRGRHGRVDQSELVTTFGVSAPTISRMLRSLEELGLVRRLRHPSDRRRLVVGLTLRGLWCVLRAIWATMSGAAALAVRSAVAPEVWHCDRKAAGQVAAFEWGLHGVRLAFGDTSTFQYMRWHRSEFYEHPLGPAVGGWTGAA
jgi:DNA-binding MarR family transcriptional regulator